MSVCQKNLIISSISLFVATACGITAYLMGGQENEDSSPLFLTPYVKSGEIAKARKLCQILDLPDAPTIQSYSGFFTVNETYNSNIFFWFVPALDGNKDAPVLLWLQGGPGLTGLFGFFVEHGPYFIHSNMTAELRKYAWTNNFHVIYVDNPVGAGFSFTDDIEGYAQNEDEMADSMYEFLQQFFQLFFEYRTNEFYIAGESYGGKYVPALSYKIHMEGISSKINLNGVAIGNGLCDPETMMDYGEYVYQLGLVDRKQANVMRNLSKSIVEQIHKKNYIGAVMGFSQLIVSFNVLPYPSYFKNFTQFNYLYNFLLTEEPAEFQYYQEYLDNPKVRKALHVGNLKMQDGRMAQKYMLLDIMQSVKPQVKVIMDNYRVLFYNGQLDLIIPYPMTINFLNSVKWKYAMQYKEAGRLTWRLNGSNVIAGYVHNVKDFYEVLVRDAGHIVPYDQPKIALDLISRFLNRQAYA